MWKETIIDKVYWAVFECPGCQSEIRCPPEYLNGGNDYKSSLVKPDDKLIRTKPGE